MIYFRLSIRKNRQDGEQSDYGRAWVDHLIYEGPSMAQAYPCKGDNIGGPEGEEYVVTKVIFVYRGAFESAPEVLVEAR